MSFYSSYSLRGSVSMLLRIASNAASTARFTPVYLLIKDSNHSFSRLRHALNLAVLGWKEKEAKLTTSGSHYIRRSAPRRLYCREVGPVLRVEVEAYR